jgi:hypothetical protein
VGLKHRCELPAWCGKTRGYVHAGCGIRNTKYESRALVLQSPRRPGVDNSPFLFWTASNTSRYIVVTSKCADHTHLLRLSIRPSIHTPHSQTHAILWLRTEIAIPKREGEVVSKPFESARRMPSLRQDPPSQTQIVPQTSPPSTSARRLQSCVRCSSAVHAGR